jgi:hypothetical protein
MQELFFDEVRTKSALESADEGGEAGEDDEGEPEPRGDTLPRQTSTTRLRGHACTDASRRIEPRWRRARQRKQPQDEVLAPLAPMLLAPRLASRSRVPTEARNTPAARSMRAPLCLVLGPGAEDNAARGRGDDA